MSDNNWFDTINPPNTPGDEGVIPLEERDVSRLTTKRAATALKKVGIETVEDVMNVEDLTSLPGIGAKTAQEIAASLDNEAAMYEEESVLESLRAELKRQKALTARLRVLVSEAVSILAELGE